MKNLRRNLPNIHQHAPDDSRAQPPRKGAHPFIAGDPPQAPDGVRVIRALCGGPGPVGAHADQDHLGRVPNDAGHAARQGRGADGGAKRKLIIIWGF